MPAWKVRHPNNDGATGNVLYRPSPFGMKRRGFGCVSFAQTANGSLENGAEGADEHLARSSALS